MSNNLIPSLKADILIIDDTPDNLRLLSQMLSQLYKVRLAPNGDIGLNAARSAPPDLILLDVMMSGINGYEVAAQLKADERTAEIPIIFISALDNTENKVLGFTVGGVDYITKPFQEKEVLARVHTHLSLRALYLRAQTEIAIRKRVEESLRKREQEYKTLVENTPDVIARFDRQYRHIYVNPVVEKEFGVPPETLLGKSHRELGQPPEAADWSENIIRQVFETGQEVVFELATPTPAGNKYYLSRGVPEFAEDGSVISVLIIHRNITERKQAEDHIRQLSRAVEASPTSIVITDTKGDIQYVNPKFTEVTGYSFSEAVGKNPRILKSDQTSPEIHMELWETIPRGKEWHGEFCNRKKNGELYWESASISPITDNKGVITHYVAVKEDITGRKQMEETLRESQSLYHSLVEVSPLSICRKDMEGRFTFANRRFLELSQTTLADLVGKTDYDLHPSELAEKYRRDDQGVIESGQVQELIEERAVLGGETVVVQSIKTPIYDGAGRVNGIQISFWDITERKRMEDALKESEEKYRKIFNNEIDAICIFDIETRRILDVNNAYLKLYGYTRDEVLQLTTDDISAEPEKTNTAIQKAWVSGDVIVPERNHRKKDGTLIQVEISAGAYTWKGKNVMFAIARDVTERKKAETALAIANKELHQRMAEIEKLHIALQEQAIRDPLTGLYNRRHMEEALTREYARTARKNEPLSIVMVDIDGLKKFNDTYGHDAGDQAIRAFADQLKLMTRKEDIACRYGGDEFLVILYNTDMENASKRVEEWHTKVNNVSIPYQGRSLHIAFSAGVATYPTHGESIDEIVKAADEALYRQKGT